MNSKKLSGLLGYPGTLMSDNDANDLEIFTAFAYMIEGIVYLKAATDDIVVATAGDAFVAQADLKSCLYRMVINAAGTVLVRQGEAVLTASISANKPLVMPKGKSGYLTFGYFRIDTSGGTYTPATTDFDGAGVTDTFVNCDDDGCPSHLNS